MEIHDKFHLHSVRDVTYVLNRISWEENPIANYVLKLFTIMTAIADSMFLTSR